MNKRNYTLSLRNKDTEKFKEFIENQSNFNESMRILIYRHIEKNGTADISKLIKESYN